jgi:hypothetical protein
MQRRKCYVLDLRQLRKEAARRILSRGTIVRSAGLSLVMLTGLEASAFAAGTGIDAGANKLYIKLLGIAKWVIVFKGGLDTIKSVADGDMQSARKSFLGYLVTYGILWALPWGMNEVDKLFKGDLEASGS